RGVIHYHAIIRLDGTTGDCQPPPARYTAAMLTQAIRQATATVSYDTTAATAADPSLGRILRFGTQTDTRVIRSGSALSAQAVANYIAKYATKTTGAPGLPNRPIHGHAAIGALRCADHFKRLIAICWELGKHPAAASLGLNRWTHMLGYR